MPAPGANLSYHNASQLWEMFFRKIGYKPRSRPASQPTKNRNMAADTGLTATFPRPIGICAKYSATAPQSNTAADAPTGVGDICISVASNNVGLAHITAADITVYRSTAYVSTTSHTWAQIV